MAGLSGGQFSDGRTAARRAVHLRLAREGLVVAGVDGTVVASWPFEDLQLVGTSARDQPVRLTSKTDPDARLTVAEPACARKIFRSAPHLRGGGRKRAPRGGRSWSAIALWGSGAAAAIALLFFALPHLAGPIATLVPVEWEMALGEELAGDFLADTDACTGIAGTAALQRLTHRLAATLDTPYSFNVVVADVDDVNAFAAPGGFIVIYRGLLEAARSPDEVAGVLAHEMGHVAKRHGAEALVRTVGLSLIFQIFVGDASGLAGLGAAAGQFLLELSYSRGDEAEADATAIAALTAADIRRDGLADFFARLDREAGNQTEEIALFSSHPLNNDRVEAIRKAPSGGGRAMSGSAWRALKTICR